MVVFLLVSGGVGVRRALGFGFFFSVAHKGIIEADVHITVGRLCFISVSLCECVCLCVCVCVCV